MLFCAAAAHAQEAKSEVFVQLGHSEWVNSVAFSPDGRYALSGSWDGTIKLWEVSNGREIRTFKGHYMAVFSVVFSPDGSYTLSGSVNATTRIWNIQTGLEVAKLVAFDDGEWVSVTPEGYFDASPGGAKHINVRGGNRIYSMDNYAETFLPSRSGAADSVR